MDAQSAWKRAARDSDKSMRSVSLEMGRSENFISTTFGKKSTPKVDTFAAMLAPCGYILAAIPKSDVPPSAIVIDPPEESE